MTIQVDLKRQPDVANLIADLDMGAKVCFITSLKSRTGELAEFTLERAEECDDETEGDDENEEGESQDEAEADGDQMKNTPKMPAPGGSKNTPGGSTDQDRLAAAVSAQL